MECALSAPAAPARLWLWPNLLSLDAPVVAVLWQILFARCFQVPLDPLAALLLLLTVWLIYAADRTLDAWRGDCPSPRHEFYRRHWRGLLPLWITVLALTAWLAAERLSPGLFLRGSILLAVVGVYFALVHSSLLRLHKEAAVGVLFALGASLVAWGKVKAPADVATILLFSGLCWMNCVAIQQWEAGKLNWSPSIAAIVLACAAGALLYAHRPVLGGAELASAFGFLLLDRVRPRLSADAVRVLADVALLSPVLFLPMVRG
ncbi:MAG: hypothetical protein ABI833_19485 [Acidobacteriota bacterium]